MMVNVVKFNKQHLKEIKLQQAQKDALSSMSATEKEYMEVSDFAFSAIDENGDVIACAGIVKLWEGRGHAWALLGENLGPKFVAITRAVKRAIDLSGFKRLEMDVESSQKAALRWAEMLGFYNETPGGMVNYTNDGRLYYKFVRVQ